MILQPHRFGNIIGVLLVILTQTARANRIQPTAILTQAPTLSPAVLSISLKAYENARKKGLDKNGIITIVDFSKPSYEKRLWVINVKKNRVLYHTFVSQGKNTGFVFAKYFSNNTNSQESSLGVYETEHAYAGKHGQSLQLRGLEKGFNDNAFQRAIVVHPAWYATAQFVKKYHHTGRSWGCFGISPKVSEALINAIKDHSLLVAYFPNARWIHHSQFLS